jgi:hypothetical protein
VTGTGTATISTSIKAFPGQTLLASGSVYSYASPLATLTLSLNTDELIDYFETTVPTASAQFFLEIKVVLSGQQRAYYLAPITIQRAISDDDDVDPTAAGAGTYALRTQAPWWRADVTTLAGLKALSTVSSAAGYIPSGSLVFYWDSGANVTGSGDATGAVLCFIVQTATTAEASPWVLRPTDYNASSNPRVFRLLSVTKVGAPCMWNSDTSKFHPVVAYGSAGAVGMLLDQTGFILS